MRDLNSLNRVLLLGHLGGKPELRYLPQKERAVVRFSLATNERFFKPDTKETSDRTEWHRIVAWGKLAEFCDRYLSQGKQVLVEGKLRTRSWVGKDGNKRYTTEVEAQNVVLLGRRSEGPSDTESYSAPAATPDFPMEDERPGASSDTEDDEVPF